MTRGVPVRTILATIALVLATFVGFLLVRELARIITWLVVAGFLAVLLTPVVDFLQRKIRFPRAVATLTVFIVAFLIISAMMFTFARPLVREASNFADNLPRFIEDAQTGRGRLGELVQRYNVEEFVEDNQDRLRQSVRDLGANSLSLVSSIANTIFAGLTILVLTFLMILQGPDITKAGLNLVDPAKRHRVRRVGADCAKACSGYMAGALLISTIAGTTTFVFLTIMGVPFNGVLALWVAFSALIPLIGATLGAIPTVAVAFLYSTPVGIATVIFYVAYQQVENNFLQPTVMSRTVNLNPLAVLVAVLSGVELFGLLGALLAIPLAGITQVIARDLWDDRRGRWKAIPTTGQDETPLGNGGPRLEPEAEPAAQPSARPESREPGTQPERDPTPTPSVGP
ncbi:MAG: AI-2E family transporter [Actinobacteria bacterium]|nr:AI-2E family transporter [Actinomycetota bacterium]